MMMMILAFAFNTNSVSGTVYDCYGDRVPGISVVLSSEGYYKEVKTNDIGRYFFNNIPNGEFVVSSLGKKYDVSFSGRSVYQGLDFVYVDGIKGRVWHDVNMDGVIDDFEDGLFCVVKLLLDGIVVDSVLTDMNGYYRFNGSVSGDYTVRAVLPGYFPTFFDDKVSGCFTNLGYARDVYGYEFAMSIGFWKTNIRKHLRGQTQGTQVSKEELVLWLGFIDSWYFDSLEKALLIFEGKDALSRFKAKMLAVKLSEFYFNSRI